MKEGAEKDARLRTSVTSRRYSCAFEHKCILVSEHMTSTSTHTQRLVVVRVDHIQQRHLDANTLRDWPVPVPEVIVICQPA